MATVTLLENRDFENRAGVVFSEDKTTVLYAEDLLAICNAIKALQNVWNALGSFIDVVSSKLYISTSVGIGTNSPTEALDVVGNIKASSILKSASLQVASPLAVSGIEALVNGDQAVFNQSSLSSELITNAGATGQTDWTDSNSDGLANNWTKSGDASASIVTGNGFSGNAQRISGGSGVNQDVLFQNVIAFPALKWTRISFKYRSSATLQVMTSNANFFAVAVPANTGNAISVVSYVCNTGSSLVDLDISFRTNSAGAWFEIDEVSVKTVTDGDLYVGDSLLVGGTVSVRDILLAYGSAPGVRIRPSLNSTSSLKIADSASSDYVVFDSTNKRVRVGGNSAPTEALDVSGNVRATGYKSSDGSSGYSGTFSFYDYDYNLRSITIKNGLITAVA